MRGFEGGFDRVESFLLLFECDFDNQNCIFRGERNHQYQTNLYINIVGEARRKQSNHRPDQRQWHHRHHHPAPARARTHRQRQQGL